MPHCPAVQIADPFVGAVQVRPQAPQWLASVVVATHASPQRTCPVAHPDTHAPAMHSGRFDGHALPQRPQAAGCDRLASQPLTALPSQSAKPGRHSNPHAPTAHTGAARGGVGHATHIGPHCVTDDSATHASPQRRKPALHTNPQAVPSQVARPLAGVAQGAQRVPQVSVLASGTQAPPQR
jgi:hypothetical protein